VILATLNVVGGFVVTDRMLEMFKPKTSERRPGTSEAAPDAASHTDAGDKGATS